MAVDCTCPCADCKVFKHCYGRNFPEALANNQVKPKDKQQVCGRVYADEGAYTLVLINDVPRCLTCFQPVTAHGKGI